LTQDIIAGDERHLASLYLDRYKLQLVSYKVLMQEGIMSNLHLKFSFVKRILSNRLPAIILHVRQFYSFCFCCCCEQLVSRETRNSFVYWGIKLKAGQLFSKMYY
jgi:hypothetical protein